MSNVDLDIVDSIERDVFVRDDRRVPAQTNRASSVGQMVIAIMHGLGQNRLCRVAALCALATLCLPVHARNGVYNLELIQVYYSDTRTAPYTTAQLTMAGGEIQSYFRALSNGNLDLRIGVVEAHLGQTNDFYNAACRPSGETRSPCPPPLFADAIEAAALRGVDFSGVNGVVLVQPNCGEDFTLPNRIRIASPHATGMVTASDDFACPISFSLGPSGVNWAGWTHEIGHQLQVADGIPVDIPWKGHPSGYGSGYDLMDSCYPCGAGAFSLLGPPLNNSVRSVFPGWLPASKVVTVERPPSPSGVTVVLAPLSQDASTTPSPQVIKIPIANGIYYLVEARRRLGIDALDLGRETGGIWDEGIKIQKIEETRNWPVTNIDACDTLEPGGCVRDNSRDPRGAACLAEPVAARPAYCWPYLLWHPGQMFADPDNAIQIRVDAEIGTGYAVTVLRGNVVGRPDLFIAPWLTPPMNTWETTDIWVDSSCNGYERDVGAAGLRYGRRADGTVVGNGDDPCIGHTNRVYAHVRNVGDAPANDVRVTFRVTDPPGVGIRDSHGWSEIGYVTSAEFPELASLAPGAGADVYITWVPRHHLTPEEVAARRFAFHTCLQVEIEAVDGEIVTSNQLAMENFNYFESRQDPVVNSWEPIYGQFYIRNPYSPNDRLAGPRTFYLNVESALPKDWTYSVAGGANAVTLESDEVRMIPVVIQPSKDAQPGDSYLLKVDASTDVVLFNPAAPADESEETGLARIAGVVLAAHTVSKAELSVSAAQDAQGNILVRGSLKPGGSGYVTLDYIFPDGATTSRTAAVGSIGDFKDAFTLPGNTVPFVRAIYQGDDKTSSAVTETKVTPGK